MYKDLLVVADATPAARHRMEVAADVAATFQAHLTGLYPLSSPDPLAYPIYEDGALMQQALQEALAKAEEHAAEAGRVFTDVTGRRGVTAEWRTANGLPSVTAQTHARYADLTVIGQIDLERPDAESLPRPEDVALGAGRPVLVVPYVGRFETVGRRAIVAWNASREATRAVNDAVPLLAAADSVTVLAINPEHGAKAHGEEPGADIALHLARHGVKAQVEQAVSDELDPGQLLLSRAADLGADLIVMGAYGHSRMREMLLGGMTRTILRSMTVPVLMSH